MYHRNMSHILISFCFHIFCVCFFALFSLFHISVARFYESYKSVKWFRFFICRKIEMGKDFYSTIYDQTGMENGGRAQQWQLQQKHSTTKDVRFHFVRSFMDHILFLVFFCFLDDAGINSNQKHRNLIQLSSLLYIWLPLCKLQYLEQLLPNQPTKQKEHF